MPFGGQGLKKGGKRRNVKGKRRGNTKEKEPG
jgi:hypothetical protein